jgi:hypothetical protein
MASVFRLRRVLLLLGILVPYPAIVWLLALCYLGGFKELAPPGSPQEVVRQVGIKDRVVSNSRSRTSEQAASPSERTLPAIDPRTSLSNLLPAPPQVNKAPVYLGDDLARVPELKLEDVPGEELTTAQWKERKAHAAAAALHLNDKEEDGFLKALLRSRPDLAGLPFLMGNDCRTTGQRAQAFRDAAEGLRILGANAHAFGVVPQPGRSEERPQFRAHSAVASQILPGEEAGVQQALIRVLESIRDPEASRALARVAVFATDEAIRAFAIDALSVRRERDYTAELVAGLRYPWPAVAENAARAIVRLERKDLVPQLKALLYAPDPRGPRTEEVAGRQVMVAPELVRINHLRNCLLCHAPADPREARSLRGTLVAEVPVPTESLPKPGPAYYFSGSNLLVRIDMTYLRQDFSALLEVMDRSAWPARQRFDFVVRKRVLTGWEAEVLRSRLAGGELPYRRAAAKALHDLTRSDLGAMVEPRRPMPPRKRS